MHRNFKYLFFIVLIHERPTLVIFARVKSIDAIVSRDIHDFRLDGSLLCSDSPGISIPFSGWFNYARNKDDSENLISACGVCRCDLMNINFGLRSLQSIYLCKHEHDHALGYLVVEEREREREGVQKRERERAYNTPYKSLIVLLLREITFLVLSLHV